MLFAYPLLSYGAFFESKFEILEYLSGINFSEWPDSFDIVDINFCKQQKNLQNRESLYHKLYTNKMFYSYHFYLQDAIAL